MLFQKTLKTNFNRERSLESYFYFFFFSPPQVEVFALERPRSLLSKLLPVMFIVNGPEQFTDFLAVFQHSITT